ncbi:MULTISPECIES: hypothetical protein [Mycobacterium]|uniref:Uncharacterized protein n=1 Tax=Mycobacterium colombiense TaxID=339268 RepID=A0A329M7V6_9MYCO|nr:MULTISPECIES: hypothetical protein [Mycobacterium]MDM4138569.1 hypothetical protein [Mycobacterium sp. FLAC0960]RAV16011.1 hypothetical protein DQP57_03850 [Mycobacterium colombiense]
MSSDIINAYLVRHGDTGETVITAFRNVLTDKQVEMLNEHRRRYPRDQIRPLPNADIPATVLDRITQALDAEPGLDVVALAVQTCELFLN